MATALGIFVSAFIAFALVIFSIRSRRAAGNPPSSDANRRRAVVGDHGDDVVWEVGKLRPIAATKEFDEQLSKRSFLKRAAFTVSAFSVAWLASRGKSVAFGSELRSTDGTLGGMEGSIKADPHNDSTYHVDNHTDANGSGPNHADSHTDTGTSHTDQAAIQPPHNDHTDHYDNHTDANGSGPNHGDAHSDTGTQHTDQ
jgi:hypothetical protein